MIRVPGQRGAFASITTLFFAWGFITASVDPLIAALRAIFSLSYREAGLTQFAFFIAYGVVSLPAAALVRRAGYPSAIVIALAGPLIVRLAVSVPPRNCDPLGRLTPAAGSNSSN